jgi:predicted nucleotidyltransferase
MSRCGRRGQGNSTVKHQPDITRLHGIFARYADIQAVYLVGSRAAGTAHAGSDLDLAILSRGPSMRARKLDLLTDLARHGFGDVDVVNLDTDDIVTRYEAVRLNELVYAAADFDRGALYSNIVRQYLDSLPYLNVQRAAFKRSILGGQD